MHPKPGEVSFLIGPLRFESPQDCIERAKEDQLTAISSQLLSFIKTVECYRMRETVCVNEMLITFHGRCSFHMYMPNKPAKYGIKVMGLADAHTQYLYNACIYSGKEES